MLKIDIRSSVPLNEQIKSALAGLIARGALRPGDPAPSVRGLAESLKVNPNTVARAVRELAAEGLLETRRGDGTYIAASAPAKARGGLEQARRSLTESLRLARRSGLEWSDVEAAVKDVRREEP